jgi:hypothetical protein
LGWLLKRNFVYRFPPPALKALSAGGGRGVMKRIQVMMSKQDDAHGNNPLHPCYFKGEI